MTSVRLAYRDRQLEFVHTPLMFARTSEVDLFARKNNKTLGETVQQPRYHSLRDEVTARYPRSLDEKLGAFLLALKRAGDPFYRRFLNPHGDEVYCQLSLADASVAKQKGLYCFSASSAVKYIGKCRDSFGKRINWGYGHISPKNCYRDGRSTNCHLNALIARRGSDVALYVHPLQDNAMIDAIEPALIARYKPEWNVQLAGDPRP